MDEENADYSEFTSCVAVYIFLTYGRKSSRNGLASMETLQLLNHRQDTEIIDSVLDQQETESDGSDEDSVAEGEKPRRIFKEIFVHEKQKRIRQTKLMDLLITASSSSR
ncbi:hypothetical protein PR048_020077 [Dryococelus australis]|uniref:Uncharacterized protein n=1 Tax=Dryococelus australis TaxID=614101 RepID=A0ABQ9H599_9NEOP|nr:hypothetical protein PR048_020077 [Dryococelus australis]